MSFQVRRLAEEKKRPKVPWSSVFKAGLWLAAPVVSLRKHWKKRKEEKQKEEKEIVRTNILKRILVILTTVLCAVILFAGTVKALVSLKILSLHTITGVAGAPLPEDEHGHTNILLLGQGDEGHQGADLTDTMMVASIDPETESVALLSIPRDLYLTKPGDKMQPGRINEQYWNYRRALEFGPQKMDRAAASQIAMRELADQLGNLLGMEIHHTVKVDFIGFVQAVDAIGGIEVDVPQALVDTSYPGPNYTYQVFSINAGPQTLDGETALKYARSRHSTSDFDRSKRQQMIIKAVGDKVKSQGLLTKPNQLLELMNIMQNHIETSMTFRELLSLADLGQGMNRDRLITMNIRDGSGPGGFLYPPPRDLFGGAAILLPLATTGTNEGWEGIRTLVKLMIHIRTPFLDPATINVYNAGAPGGSSRSLGFELIKYGFTVDEMANSPSEEDSETSYIDAYERDREQAEFLSNMLKIPLRPLQDDEGVVAGTGTVLPVNVNLGKDYVFTPVATLMSEPDPATPSLE